MSGRPVDRDDPAGKSIVFIDVKNGDNCSGVVYREKEIITAAHCVVDDKNKKINPRRITVYYTRKYEPGNGDYRNVVEISVNPDFELGQRDGSYWTAEAASVDIAILKLSDVHPIGAISAIILRAPNSVKHRKLRLARSHSYVEAYGFGKEEKINSYLLRKGQMTIDSVSSKLRIIDGRPRLSGLRMQNGKKYELCPGDSGGGVFYVMRNRRGLVFENENPALAGIVVSGSKHQCSDEGRMISLSPYRNWILSQ
jgi:hypothetical protein